MTDDVEDQFSSADDDSSGVDYWYVHMRVHLSEILLHTTAKYAHANGEKNENFIYLSFNIIMCGCV